MAGLPLTSRLPIPGSGRLRRHPQEPATDDQRKRRTPGLGRALHRQDIAGRELPIGASESAVAVATRQKEQLESAAGQYRQP